MTLGTVFLLFSYTGLLTANLADLTEQLNDLQGASAAMARIGDLYAAQPRIQDGLDVAVPPGPPGITFDGVSGRGLRAYSVLVIQSRVTSFRPGRDPRAASMLGNSTSITGTLHIGLLRCGAPFPHLALT